jgi:hypothetical protein
VHRSKRRLQPEFGKIDAKQKARALTHEPCECVSALASHSNAGARQLILAKIQILPSDTPDTIAGRDWDAIKRDYTAGELVVPELCALHSISRDMLYRYAKAQDWVLRRGARKYRLERPETRMAKRLVAALEVKMRRFEVRLAENDGASSAADGERDARTLNTLVRLFEKLKGLGAVEGGNAPLAKSADGQSNGAKPYDAERIRNQLAQRLECLRGQLGGRAVHACLER